MGFCETFSRNRRILTAEQRVRRAMQKAQTTPKTEVLLQRRQVQYLCDQVQLAVAARKPEDVIDALLDELSLASGRPRMTV